VVQLSEQISATRSPEAARDRRFPRLRQEHAEWTSPLTNRLLFEAVGMHLYERWGDMHLRVKGGSLTDASQEAILPQLIGVLDQSNGLNYRVRTINLNQNFAAYLRPTEILNARVAKLSVNFDF
jgi:hypothetical protein